jgi:16S rRNA (guanine966-N2)-methyltransferase
MRIVGGEARGRQIRLPGGCHVRPTTDRVKEALFNILPSVGGMRFLDICAGCGNVGLEALSRGARHSVFIEKSLRLVAAIRENLRLLGFEGRAEVMAGEAQKGIVRLTNKGEEFDILFADPPYDAGLLEKSLGSLKDGRLLAGNAVIVLQHSVRETVGEDSTYPFALTDQRRYGDTLLTFLEKRGEEFNI